MPGFWSLKPQNNVRDVLKEVIEDTAINRTHIKVPKHMQLEYSFSFSQFVWYTSGGIQDSLEVKVFPFTAFYFGVILIISFCAISNFFVWI